MNMLTRWVPGDILVAVADGGVLALDGSAPAMEAMWTELGEHRSLGDLLRSLSRLHRSLGCTTTRSSPFPTSS